jgi:DNA polymerase-3 subunit delta
LHSEIKKLAVLYREGEKITRELVSNVCVKSMQGIIFDLTDAIGNKEKKKSLELINELILKKEAEQFILIMLYKHFRNLYLLRVATDEGRASTEELGINPYVYRKLLGQVKNYDSKELKNILFKLISLDGKSKKGEIDLRVGLEVILTVDVK